MFGKLRLRLSLMNAAVAALILVAIAGVSYYFIARIIARQSEQALTSIVSDVESMGLRTAPAGALGAGGLYPYTVVRADGNGGFRQVVQLGVEELTGEQLTELLTLALTKPPEDAGRSVGSVRSGSGFFAVVFRSSGRVLRLASGRAFRYAITGIRTDTSRIYFVFMDIAQEEEQLASVRLALGLAVAGGLLLTLLGGLFLAGRALRPIRTAWQKQRSFVADASHELRSPLAAIRCNLDVVLDDPSLPVGDKQAYWEGISEETARMSLLVDELLLLARADSDAVVLQKERVDVAETAESAVAVMRPVAQKKGIELSVAATGFPSVLGDRARLKQVLIALIDNAVKYTPEGGRAALTVRKTKDRALVDVEDSGIGIPAEHLDKIFDRFYRVDRARERESGGHGLGLSIAQWLAQQMGGHIAVASEEGRGSCFTVSLPLIREKDE
jgi:two-component system sensor histidine kinase CiaH